MLTLPSSYYAGVGLYPFTLCERHSGVYEHTLASGVPTVLVINQNLLPQLATYLGHVSIAATQVYLTMTPELLRAASVRFERYALPEAYRD